MLGAWRDTRRANGHVMVTSKGHAQNALQITGSSPRSHGGNTGSNPVCATRHHEKPRPWRGFRVCRLRSAGARPGPPVRPTWGGPPVPLATRCDTPVGAKSGVGWCAGTGGGVRMPLMPKSFYKGSGWGRVLRVDLMGRGEGERGRRTLPAGVQCGGVRPMLGGVPAVPCWGGVPFSSSGGGGDEGSGDAASGGDRPGSEPGRPGTRPALRPGRRCTGGSGRPGGGPGRGPPPPRPWRREIRPLAGFSFRPRSGARRVPAARPGGASGRGSPAS